LPFHENGRKTIRTQQKKGAECSGYSEGLFLFAYHALTNCVGEKGWNLRKLRPIKASTNILQLRTSFGAGFANISGKLRSKGK